jgi:hypothetical protein
MLWILVLGAAVFVIYLIGYNTAEARIRRPIIDTSTFPEWAKVLTLIVVVCVILMWLIGT